MIDTSYRMLDTMEDNELCPGDELVINSSDAIECKFLAFEYGSWPALTFNHR